MRERDIAISLSPFLHCGSGFLAVVAKGCYPVFVTIVAAAE